ncbi:efflux RND transporter permease subunit [Magnetovibrio blakemorei]|uniref:Acriflavin resistance protein n=1 Tax=Magnetovibrio blakemorei TaxID=28181 RepID=A0A1E5Q4K4_9PROT|nr:efflux RND transporter permease subunit [Magnetovibrio blakemorei]OEJ65119.1 acriflavin resistance protein [Magnetovibrio blakemorei]
MQGIIDLAFHHARTTISTLLLLLIAGSVAYVEIPKEAEPDINIPLVIVRVVHEGISPEDSESLIIRPLELELRSVEGLKEMRAKGYEGGANIVLEFEAGFDVKQALSDVREKVDDAKPDLPADSEDPVIEEINFSEFPIVVVSLSGDVPERALLQLGRDLKDELEGLTPVLKAQLTGTRDEMVEILIDPVKVESYGLSPDTAIANVKSSNKLVAAGAQDTGRGSFTLKVPGLLKDVRDIMALPVTVDGDAVVRLGDIGEVRRAFKDPSSFARINGARAVTLEISKRSGENLIETVSKVRALVENERASWPDGLKNAVNVTYAQDKSTDIKERLSTLENSVISAVLLVMIVVVAALGLRSAGLVGVAIPGSFLTGVLVLNAMGMTMNIVVLFGLVLAVGMLVDGAIVVTEYADRKMSEGLHRKKAYALAAKRMAGPIIAATLTTLAAFLPLLFWPGVVGEFMKYLPITLIATLSASLLMALVFVPALGAYIGKANTVNPQGAQVLKVGDAEHLGVITQTYLNMLDKALKHPVWVSLAAFATLVGVLLIYGLFGNGIEFFPKTEPSTAQVQVRARGNLSIWERDALMREIEMEILQVGGIETVYTRTRSNPTGEAAEDIVGTVFLEFDDWDKRPKADQILDEIRKRTRPIAGVIVNMAKREGGPPVGKPVQIEISSRYPELLEPTAWHIVAELSKNANLKDIEDTLPLPGIDWVFDVDRAQASKFGANVSSIGSTVRLATSGIKLGTYRPTDTDEELDIRARFPKSYRNLDQLRNLRVQTPAGQVPIANFVTMEPQAKIGTISRTDVKRVVTVKADVVEGVLADAVVKGIQAYIAAADLDPRISIRFKGEDEEQDKAKAFLVKAFGVALFLIAIILVTQFNSFYSSLLILSAVVMSTIGVFIGLLITGQPFGIVMGGIGVIALAGIVVNNNIVLIDTFDRLKQTTSNTREAIMQTGAQRLRPVLLTTVTTMLGLLPMAMNIGIDFIGRTIVIDAPANQMWVQLSISIVFGLGFATILTLILTPAMLMLRANVATWWQARKITPA